MAKVICELCKKREATKLKFVRGKNKQFAVCDDCGGKVDFFER